MKKFIALALVTLGVSVSARAQWIVFDPTMNVQSILNTARGIAEFVEMINNQVQQIQTLTDQLNEFKHYEDLFGDPKALLLTTVQPLVNDFRKTEVGETLTALEGAVDAGEAMLYDANGLFSSIGTTFSRLRHDATLTHRQRAREEQCRRESTERRGEPAPGATASNSPHCCGLFELAQRALDGSLARADRTRECRC